MKTLNFFSGTFIWLRGLLGQGLGRGLGPGLDNIGIIFMYLFSVIYINQEEIQYVFFC